MPRRRDRPPWWQEWANTELDERDYSCTLRNGKPSGPQPLHFPQRMELVGLGVARPKDEPLAKGRREDAAAVAAWGDIEIDLARLAAWTPPAGATDRAVLEAEERPVARVTISATGTRLDPASALWLWQERRREEGGSPHALAGRWKDWPPYLTLIGETPRDSRVVTASAWCVNCGRWFKDRRRLRGWWIERIAEWCPDCQHRNPRHLPPRRRCAAADCARFFTLTDPRSRYCSGACRSAQHTRRTTAA